MRHSIIRKTILLALVAVTDLLLLVNKRGLGQRVFIQLATEIRQSPVVVVVVVGCVEPRLTRLHPERSRPGPIESCLFSHTAFPVPTCKLRRGR